MSRADDAFRVGRYAQAAILFASNITQLRRNEYCKFGYSAISSGDADVFELFKSYAVDRELESYKNFFIGSWLYDIGDPQGIQLILDAAPAISAYGHVIDGEKFSWLRGIASFCDKLSGPELMAPEPFEFVAGEPKEDILFLASADAQYFRNFYKSLSGSFVADPGRIGLILNVVNPDQNIQAFLNAAAASAKERGIYFSHSRGPATKWFYACSRFLIAESLVCNSGKAVFVMDIDASFRRPCKEIISSLLGYDLAYKVKKHCLPWQRIQAGRVWISATREGYIVARALGRFIRMIYSSAIDQWFIDQNALEYVNRGLTSETRLLNLNMAPSIRDGVFAPAAGKKNILVDKLSLECVDQDRHHIYRT